MKTPLLLLGISLSFFGNAQTITLSDTLSTGDAMNYYVLDSNALSLAAVTGAGVTWDYSNIGAYSIPPNNNKVIDRTASVYSADFPTAKYAEDFENSVKTFFTNDPVSKQVYVHGFVYVEGANIIKIKYDDDFLISQKLPMNLGDTYTDLISGNAVAPLIGAIPIDGDATVIADGTGTLKLGSNTYTDVIRIHTKETTGGSPLGGSLSITRESYVYYDLATQKMPIFIYVMIEINASAFGVYGFTAVYGKDNITDYVGLSEMESADSELTVYPNPALGDFVTVSTENGTEVITIINAVGQVVMTVNNPNSLEQVNISSLNKGVYFVQATKEGDVKTSKFVVK